MLDKMKKREIKEHTYYNMITLKLTQTFNTVPPYPYTNIVFIMPAAMVNASKIDKRPIIFIKEVSFLQPRVNMESIKSGVYSFIYKTQPCFRKHIWYFETPLNGLRYLVHVPLSVIPQRH